MRAKTGKQTINYRIPEDCNHTPGFQFDFYISYKRMPETTDAY
jgi:hypothetical protein